VCTITNDDIQPIVTVTKDLVPAADPGRFNLLIDGTQYATNVGDNGTTGPIGIDAGSRTVSETGGTVPPTNLANYTSSINCGAKGSGSGTSLSINLNPGDVVTCVISNTIQDADADGIPNFLDCTSLYESRVVDPTGSLAAYLPASRRHATLQLAVNAAADNDVISMYANTTENVEIGGAGVGAAAAGKDLRIVGCGHKVTAANASKPVINILGNAGKNDGTNTGAGEKDIHIDDLDVRGGTYGYLVQTSKPGGNNTSTMLKAIRATNNGVGVSIVGSGNELRSANGINFNTSGGVQVNGNNNSINNNRIESNTGTGLSAAGGGLDINKNIVTGNSGHGIVVVGCAANKIQENDVFSNGGAGIIASGNGSLIKKNEVGDSGKGNGGDGITVNASSTEVSENDVFANNGRGIVVTGNTNIVKKNKVGDAGKGNTGDGIRLTGDGNSVGKDLDQNDVFANGGSGIVVTGNNNTLSKNDVGDRGKGNGGDGIRVAGYGNTLTENDSFANGGDGFDISGGTAAKPNKLIKNNAGKSNAGNGGNGFLVAGNGNPKAAPTELDQNTAKGNTLNGFRVTGTGMDLSKNTSGGNSGDDNGDWEFLVASGNWNLGGNKYNSTTLGGSTPSAFPTSGLGTP
jgi:parallel beta-helix repeat protein